MSQNNEAVNLGKIRKVFEAMQITTVYLDDLFSNEDKEGDDWQRYVISNSAVDPELYIEAKEEIAALKKRLEKIEKAMLATGVSPRNQKMFWQRFGLDGNYCLRGYQEIGDLAGGITKQAVEQIIGRIFIKLQDAGVQEDEWSLVELVKKIELLQEIISQADGEQNLFDKFATGEDEFLKVQSIGRMWNSRKVKKIKERLRSKPEREALSLNLTIESGKYINLSVGEIIGEAALRSGFSTEEILGKRRTQDLALVRQEIMYILNKECKLPFLQIARILKRDHSTVMYGCRKIEKMLNNNERRLEDI